jgi:hypothetical protein
MREVIPPLAQYAFMAWCLVKHRDNFTFTFRLRIFGNGMLRRIFEPKRKDVTGSWRKLHNKDLCYLSFSSDIIRVMKSLRMRWSGHVGRIEEIRCVYAILVRKSEE